MADGPAPSGAHIWDLLPSAMRRLWNRPPAITDSSTGPLAAAGWADLRYTIYGEREMIPGPFSGKGAELRVCFLKCDPEHLKTLVRRALTDNRIGPTEYHPIGDRVAIAIVHTAKIRSEVPPYSDYGFVEEWQACVAIPLLVGKTHGGIFIPHGLGLAIPYILVDNPICLVAGRDIFGYPKSLGRFKWSENTTPPAENWRAQPVSVAAFGGDRGRDKQPGWHILLRVTPPEGDVARHDKWREFSDVIQHYVGGQPRSLRLPHLPGGELPWRVIEAIMPGSSHHVLLKEFRDDDETDRAAYRKVINLPVACRSIEGGPAGACKVEIWPLQSHPIIDDLGLDRDASGSGCATQYCESFTVNMDYVLGKTDWLPDDPA